MANKKEYTGTDGNICYSTFHLGSLASSGKDHFHNWKEQSCLSVRMDTSPSENLNFSAQLSIQERTRQTMCSVPTSKWYNGIAS